MRLLLSCNLGIVVEVIAVVEREILEDGGFSHDGKEGAGKAEETREMRAVNQELQEIVGHRQRLHQRSASDHEAVLQAGWGPVHAVLAPNGGLHCAGMAQLQPMLGQSPGLTATAQGRPWSEADWSGRTRVTQLARSGEGQRLCAVVGRPQTTLNWVRLAACR